ncbi:hypothetical protein E2562_028056 [Oryza meyeriana var. granulata]|uniref:Uncharacterized protein n=1 Tax=Oryza meyeriana var. granulata TaxID=110450 RepID=A0A6G1BZR2_9ORYZ|nr:hypothetical protein E2562_028056 [Oryza meyeriana var. granulata]
MTNTDLLGLDYPQPFATTTGLNGTSLLGGVNYASAAAGSLDETGQHLRFSLSQQVVNLESNLDTIRLHMEDHGGYEEYLARSIAVMVLGSNDYINCYLLTSLLTSLYDSDYNYKPQDYADLLINHYTR